MMHHQLFTNHQCKLSHSGVVQFLFHIILLAGGIEHKFLCKHSVQLFVVVVSKLLSAGIESSHSSTVSSCCCFILFVWQEEQKEHGPEEDTHRSDL
jgi:hypothetical protein